MLGSYDALLLRQTGLRTCLDLECDQSLNMLKERREGFIVEIFALTIFSVFLIALYFWQRRLFLYCGFCLLLAYCATQSIFNLPMSVAHRAFVIFLFSSYFLAFIPNIHWLGARSGSLYSRKRGLNPTEKIVAKGVYLGIAVLLLASSIGLLIHV